MRKMSYYKLKRLFITTFRVTVTLGNLSAEFSVRKQNFEKEHKCM